MPTLDQSVCLFPACFGLFFREAKRPRHRLVAGATRSSCVENDDPGGNRTPNLSIWSRTRYHCATKSTCSPVNRPLPLLAAALYPSHSLIRVTQYPSRNKHPSQNKYPIFKPSKCEDSCLSRGTPTSFMAVRHKMVSVITSPSPPRGHISLHSGHASGAVRSRPSSSRSRLTSNRLQLLSIRDFKFAADTPRSDSGSQPS